ncbi:MAG: hypothetical protein EBT64_09685, partial [Gammaproteobacteria bacterium]|nr:hypothetical protein [Gammaproteobacteria bacterium]
MEDVSDESILDCTEPLAFLYRLHLPGQSGSARAVWDPHKDARRMETGMRYLVAADTGGTFTDIAVYDAREKRVLYGKSLTRYD